MKNLYKHLVFVILVIPSMVNAGELRPTFEVDKPKVCLTSNATSESITFTNTTEEALWEGKVTYNWKFINKIKNDTLFKEGPGPFTIIMTEGDWEVRLDAIDEDEPEKNEGFTTQNVYLGREKTISIGEVPKICDGNEVIVDGGEGFESYIWLRGADTVGNLQKLRTSKSGIYVLHALSFAGCGSKDTVEIVMPICTALEDFSIDKQLYASPNPTSEALDVHVKLNNSNSLKLSIINPMGYTLYAEAFGETTFLEKRIDISTYAKGIYYLQYQLNHKTVKTEKIVVQ